MDVLLVLLLRELTKLTRDVVGHLDHALIWPHLFAMLHHHPLLFFILSPKLQHFLPKSIDFEINFLFFFIERKIALKFHEKALPLVIKQNCCILLLTDIKITICNSIESSLPVLMHPIWLVSSHILVAEDRTPHLNWLFKHPDMPFSPCQLDNFLVPFSQLWNRANDKYLLADINLMCDLKVYGVSLLHRIHDFSLLLVYGGVLSYQGSISHTVHFIIISI